MRPAARYSAEQDNPLWAYATRTIQATGDVKQLALRMHHEPLRQYLALRLGSEVEARSALADIGVAIAKWDVEKLTGPPGPRARLFWLARSYAVQSGRWESAQIPRQVRLQCGEGAWQTLQQVPAEDAEILELRYARELSTTEIAYVLNLPLSQVEQLLDEAEKRAVKALQLSDRARVAQVAARTFAVEADPEAETSVGYVAPLAPGTRVGQRYVVEGAVGVGAFGQVYRASDSLVPGHTVALKLLHYPAANDAQRETALRELRLIASVFHPCIVSFKDHGWYEGRLWFVMPWYDGVSLQERLMAKRLSRAEAVRVFVPLANALASMHAAGVRHQDIKPENIFLAELKTDPRGADQLQPVLIDLGVAATDAESLIAGTPAYFAPEVAATYLARGDGSELTAKADVFALALSLRNALEPETAEGVDGTALTGFLARRAQRAPAPPTAKGLRFLRQHFERWLALDPESRPSAAEFAEELSVLLEPERRARQRAAFVSWFVPLTAVFLVVLAGGAFVWSQQTRAHERSTFQAQMKARSAQISADREARLRRGLEVKNEKLQTEHQRTQRKHDQLAAVLSETELAARELAVRAAKLAKARTATVDSLSKTGDELAEANEKADELTTTKEELEARLQESRLRVKELLEQASAGDELLTESRALLDRAQNKSTALSDDVERLEAERDAQQAREAELTRKNEQRRDELQQARARIAELEGQLKGAAARPKPSDQPAKPPREDKKRDRPKRPAENARPADDEAPAEDDQPAPAPDAEDP